jgi:hypothetical protein
LRANYQLSIATSSFLFESHLLLLQAPSKAMQSPHNTFAPLTMFDQMPITNLLAQLANAQQEIAGMHHYYYQRSAHQDAMLKAANDHISMLNHRVCELEEEDGLEPQLHKANDLLSQEQKQTKHLRKQLAALHQKNNARAKETATLVERQVILETTNAELHEHSLQQEAKWEKALENLRQQHRTDVLDMNATNDLLRDLVAQNEKKVDDANNSVMTSIHQIQSIKQNISNTRKKMIAVDKACQKWKAAAEENEEFIAAAHINAKEQTCKIRALEAGCATLRRGTTDALMEAEKHLKLSRVYKIKHGHFLMMIAHILQFFAEPGEKMPFDDAFLAHRLTWTLSILVSLVQGLVPDNLLSIASRKQGPKKPSLWSPKAGREEEFNSSSAYKIDLKLVKTKLDNLYKQGTPTILASDVDVDAVMANVVALVAASQSNPIVNGQDGPEIAK